MLHLRAARCARHVCYVCKCVQLDLPICCHAHTAVSVCSKIHGAVCSADDFMSACAMQMGAVSLVDALLTGCASTCRKHVQARDKHGVTPLLLAAQHGQCAAIATMLRKSTALAAPPKQKPPDATLPPSPKPSMHAESSSKRALQLLAEHDELCAAAWLCSFCMVQVSSAVSPNTIILDAADSDGVTALHAACAGNKLAFAELLTRSGCSCAALMRDYSSAVHCIASVGPKASAEVLQVVLRSSADMLAAKGYATDTKSSALHVAAFCGSAHLIKMLSAFCNLNEQNASGYTPIVLAIQMGQLPCIRELIGCGADLDVTPTEKCAPPILFAAQKNDNAILKALLDAGADANKTTDSQQAALYRAASLNNDVSVKMLLEAGADVNCTDADGSTALHIAANNNCIKVVRLLLQHSANPATKTTNGHAPIHYAAGHGNLEMAVALVDAGAPFRERGSKASGAVDVVTALVNSKKCKASASVIQGRLNTVEHRRVRRREALASDEGPLPPLLEQPAEEAAAEADRNMRELVEEEAAEFQRRADKADKEKLKRKKAKQRGKLEGAAAAADAPDAPDAVSAQHAAPAAEVADAPAAQDATLQHVSAAGSRQPSAERAAAVVRSTGLPDFADADTQPPDSDDGFVSKVNKKQRQRAAAAASLAEPVKPADQPARTGGKAQPAAKGGASSAKAADAADPGNKGGRKKKRGGKGKQQNGIVDPADGAARGAGKSGKAAARAAATPNTHIPALHAGANMPSELHLDEDSFPELGASRAALLPAQRRQAAQAPPQQSAAASAASQSPDGDDGRNACETAAWSALPPPAGTAAQKSAAPAPAAGSAAYADLATALSCCSLSDPSEGGSAAARLSHLPSPREAALPDQQNSTAASVPGAAQGVARGMSLQQQPQRVAAFRAPAAPVSPSTDSSLQGVSTLPESMADSTPFVPFVETSGRTAQGQAPVHSDAQVPPPVPQLSAASLWPASGSGSGTPRVSDGSFISSGPPGGSSAAAAFGPFATALGWDLYGPKLPAMPESVAHGLHDVHVSDLTPAQRAHAEERHWICPLTRDLMRDPVYSNTWTVYEREALAVQQRMGHNSERISSTHSSLRAEICAALQMWGLWPRR